MKEDIGQKNYRKLVYFFKNNIKIHFKDLDKIWYNGTIIDLDEKKLCMVFRERIKGTLPILLEDIKTESISEFREERGE